MLPADTRWPEIQSLLIAKSAQWHPATNVGEVLLQSFGQTLGDHLGYTVLSFPRPIKRWSRICQKATEICEQDERLPAAGVADRIRDIGGGRILVIGLQDLDVARQHFEGYIRVRPSEFDLWAFEVFVDSCRPGGFRGIGGGVYLLQPDLNRYPFEVQIMTPLQHAWDKLQHPVYEKVRSKGQKEPPPEIVEWFQKLSDKLYCLDKEIAEKQQEFRRVGYL